MSDYALQFTASNKSLIRLGTLGNLGSQIGDGLYLKFDVKTTQLTSVHGYGLYATNDTSRFWITLTNTVKIHVGDNSQSGNKLAGYATNYKKLNDGKRHTVEMQVYPTINTISIKIDDENQVVTYTWTQAPSTFSNFTGYVVFGGVNINQYNGYESYFTGTLDNLKIGTSADAIYGSWGFNEGTGTTSDDATVNGNTATLTNGTGGSIPVWVTGLRRIYINVGSEVWRVGTDLHIKVNGSWKKVKKAYVQISGDWKVIY